MARQTITYAARDGQRVDLVDLKLTWDNTGVYLSATYEVENDRHVRSVTVPKVRLPINQHKVRIDVDPFYETVHAELGYGETVAFRGHIDGVDCDAYYFERDIVNKPRKMTVAEIEEKLGYKIEIVSEEG